MLRRFFLTLGLAVSLLTACQPGPSLPTPTVSPATALIPVPTSIPHADAIRFALIGETNLTNVWAYYDEPGIDYNNRAVQAEYWPSLFRLAPGSGTVEPYLAATVSPFEPDSGFFASTVTLRSNLFWSDGTPLTAADVAFTVNAALQFHLGLNWAEAYDPAILDHVDVVGPQAARFYFRAQPSISEWQYGALQGPVVNAAFWGPRIMEPAAHLTLNPALDAEIINLQNEQAVLQRELDDLLTQLALLDPASSLFAETNDRIYAKQDEINSLGARIEEKKAERESVYVTAREVLYRLPAEGEPVFGPFMSGSRGGDEFENVTNPYFTFYRPNFNRALYRIYPDEESAVRALYAGEVNAVLQAGGVTPQREGETLPPLGDDVQPQRVPFLRSNLRVLAFDLSQPAIADVNLRRAIVCMSDGGMFSSVQYPGALILSSEQFGLTPDPQFPCASLTLPERLAKAVRILEEAGYTWDVKPAWDGAPRAGSGLKRGGVPLPGLSLIVAQEDAVRVNVAEMIADWMRVLGMPAQVETLESPELMIRVFDTGQFDMALLGWRVARVPAYLCDWFDAPNPYRYQRVELSEHCAAFRSALDLETARREAGVIHSLIAQDLPLAPVYSEQGYDLYAGVTYPFVSPLDGITGWYGAPWLAIPVRK